MVDRVRTFVYCLSWAGLAVILTVFFTQRFGLYRLPVPVVRLGIVTWIVLSSLFWWAWVDRRLWGPDLKGATWPRRRWPRAAWAVYVAVMLSPLLIVIFGGRHWWDALPVLLLMWAMVWHMLMVMRAGAGVVAGTVRAPIRWLRRRRKRPPADESPVDLNRRAILRRVSVAIPLVLTGTAVVGGLRQSGRFRIRKISMTLPNLPDRLRGLTITHLTDLHVGRLFRPEHLPAMVDAANELDSDILAVTGDIIDHSNDFLPAAWDAISRIRYRYGRFTVLGNHDLIDSGERLIEYLVPREPQLLIDRTASLIIDGEVVQIAGLFWSRYDTARGNDPGHATRVERTLASARPDRFTIALAHHPHAFDPLADRDVDLTLSGHTHGGQLMFTRPGAARPVGGGAMIFRYLWGPYYRGNSALQVSAGVGNWFPFRLNAPAELVQIRLT